MILKGPESSQAYPKRVMSKVATTIPDREVKRKKYQYEILKKAHNFKSFEKAPNKTTIQKHHKMYAALDVLEIYTLKLRCKINGAMCLRIKSLQFVTSIKIEETQLAMNPT